MRKQILSLITLILLISLASASVVCNPNSITTNYNQGESHSINIVCTNSGNYTSISTSGETSLFSSSETAFNPGSKTITISFSDSASPGLHTGTLNFPEAFYSVPIFFNVEEVISGCSIDIFPTVLTNIKVTQGEIKTRNIQLSVPSCMNNNVQIYGVALQSDQKPIQLGEISIGAMQPGDSILIPIEINAEGVSSGTYQDTLQFLIYDHLGNKINVPSVSLSVLVTQGIQSITNFSLTELPTCSLSSIEMNLNSSYTMTCSFTNPDIQINPIIDSFYIKGKSVSETSSQYIYTFEAKNIGQTKLIAEFTYKNAPVGSPFEQEVRISPSGNSPVAGTELEISFYQNGVKRTKEDLLSGSTAIFVTDSKTDSVITSDKYLVILNGQESNNSIILDSGKYYELRIASPGYVDKVINFTPSSVPIEIVITPLKEFYLVGDSVNISDNVNSSYLLDSKVISPQHTFSTPGDKILKAVKEGYESVEINVSVKSQINMIASTPPYSEWKRGKKVLFELSESTKWKVEYEKSNKKDGILNYESPVLIMNGDGISGEFKIEGSGRYTLKAEDLVVISKDIQSPLSDLSWKKLKSSWVFWVVVVALAVLLIWFLFIRQAKDKEGSLSFQAPMSGE